MTRVTIVKHQIRIKSNVRRWQMSKWRSSYHRTASGKHFYPTPEQRYTSFQTFYIITHTEQLNIMESIAYWKCWTGGIHVARFRTNDNFRSNWYRYLYESRNGVGAYFKSPYVCESTGKSMCREPCHVAIYLCFMFVIIYFNWNSDKDSSGMFSLF